MPVISFHGQESRCRVGESVVMNSSAKGFGNGWRGSVESRSCDVLRFRSRERFVGEVDDRVGGDQAQEGGESGEDGDEECIVNRRGDWNLHLWSLVRLGSSVCNAVAQSPPGP